MGEGKGSEFNTVQTPRALRCLNFRRTTKKAALYKRGGGEKIEKALRKLEGLLFGQRPRHALAETQVLSQREGNRRRCFDVAEFGVGHAGVAPMIGRCRQKRSEIHPAVRPRSRSDGPRDKIMQASVRSVHGCSSGAGLFTLRRWLI